MRRRSGSTSKQTDDLRARLTHQVPPGRRRDLHLKAQDGTVIWQDQIEQGDWVWVLPGIYTCDLLELVGDPILMSFTVQTLPGSATQVEIFTAP